MTRSFIAPTPDADNRTTLLEELQIPATATRGRVGPVGVRSGSRVFCGSAKRDLAHLVARSRRPSGLRLSVLPEGTPAGRTRPVYR